MDKDNGQNNYQEALDRSMAMLMAFTTLDISKMDIRDQLSVPIIFLDMAKMVEPYVKKYGGSVGDITTKYEKQRAETKMKDYLAAMMLKAINKGSTVEEKDDEQDS